ncbi:hypothetical protein CDL12_06335 [Handroanthus impetiginosus]|uniref:C2H2-type domain-containing protein n=1 Tax=Handroanthus impetiginosus TaxID=429701 RepID=A0A2G9HTX7_9LAMI|nr:hypothetical protein CDL12_06335 [Handroanthus impetiginosus]
MACVDDQQPNFKHYCRVCKKGFMCGRALGGHMRAHGIGDENGTIDDDDTVSDWEEKFGSGSEIRTNNKRMYQLRTNPNRLKSCRTCENCGKEFLSWKSFLEHGNGKCTSDDASDSLASDSDGEDDGGGGGRRGGGGWSKRKRSLRSKVGCLSSTYLPSEEDDLLLARCLVQLANTTVDPPAVEPEESCASASRDEERRNPATFFAVPTSKTVPFDHKAKGVQSPKGLFECKACKKVFNSHQALGGHRASHKKVKGCYAAKQDQVEDNRNLAGEDDVITNDQEFLPSKGNSSYQFEQGPALVGAARRKSKVHECTICHRVFSSGQALGGHKRCHWITSNSPDTSSSLPKFNFQDNIEPIHNHNQHQSLKTMDMDISDKLDLNVPAWAQGSGVRQDPQNPLSFEVSTDMQLQPWIGHDAAHSTAPRKEYDNNGNNNVSNKVNNENNGNDKGMDYVEDEADSKVKLAKLSDLEEMETSGSSSKWLQVGIGSTNEAAADS